MEEFYEKYAPFYGDVIFTREPSPASRGIRAAQAVRNPIEAIKGRNYSHAALVVDCNMIIHATLDRGVHLVGFKSFFATPGMQFEVVRSPTATYNSDDTGERMRRAFYYHAQKYDRRFIRRFLAKMPEKKQQLCSTLVANMIVNFDLATVGSPNLISPNKLLAALTSENGWHPISSKYSQYLELISGNGVDTDEIVELMEENLEMIHRGQIELPMVNEVLIRMLEQNLEGLELMGMDASDELAQLSELRGFENDLKEHFLFEDTDED